MRPQIIGMALAVLIAFSGCASSKGSLFGSKSKSTDTTNSKIASSKSDGKKSPKQEEPGDPLGSRKETPVAFRGGSGTSPSKKKDSRLENPDQPFGDNTRLTSNRSIRDLMRDGAKYESQQKWDQAVDSYESVLLSEPQHADAHHRLAVIADRREDYRLADQHYRVAMQRKPTDANLLSDVGYSHFLRGELDRAEGYLKQAIESDNKHRVAHLNLGLVYGKQNRYSESLAMFQAVASEEEVQRNMATLFPDGPPAGQGTQLASHRNATADPAGRTPRNDLMPEWANTPAGSQPAGSASTNSMIPPAGNPTSSDAWALSSPGMASPGMASNGMASNGMASNGMASNGMNSSPANARVANGNATNSQPAAHDFWQGNAASNTASAEFPPRSSSVPSTGLAPRTQMANSLPPAQGLPTANGSFNAPEGSGMNSLNSPESMAARSLGTPIQTNSAALAAELAMNSGWGNLFPTNSNYGTQAASPTTQGSPSVPQLPVMTQQTAWPQAPGEYRDPAAGNNLSGNNLSRGGNPPATVTPAPPAGMPGDTRNMNPPGTSAAAGVWPTTSVPWNSPANNQPSTSSWGESSQLANRPQANGTMNQAPSSMPQIQAGPSSSSTFDQQGMADAEKPPLFPSVQWASPHSTPWNSTTQGSATQSGNELSSQIQPAGFQQEVDPRSSTSGQGSATGNMSRSHANSPEPWPYGPAAGINRPNVRPTASLSVDGRSGTSNNSTSGPPPWPYGQ